MGRKGLVGQRNVGSGGQGRAGKGRVGRKGGADCRFEWGRPEWVTGRWGNVNEGRRGRAGPGQGEALRTWQTHWFYVAQTAPRFTTKLEK